MNIITERLILRAFTLNDVEGFFELVQEGVIKKYLQGVYADNKSEIKENITIYKSADFKNDYYYAIENKKTGELIGALIATRMNKHEIEVAYFIAPNYRRCGLMKEALTMFLRRVEAINGGTKFKFAISKDNIPSIRLMKSLRIPIESKTDTQYFFKISGGLRYDN